MNMEDGVVALVQRTAWHTKIQWAVVGSFLVGLGSFVTYGLGKLDMVNTAMAQTEARSQAAIEKANRLESRIEAVDAGVRAGLERLERKIDSNNESSDRKLEKFQATMELVLKEVRKR